MLLSALLLLSGVLPLFVIRAQHGTISDYWSDEAQLAALAWFGGGTIAAVLLRLWLPQRASLLLASATLIGLVLATGVLPALTTFLFMLACTLTGQLLLQRLLPDNHADSALVAPFFGGLAVYGALFSILTHYHVNFPTIIAALLVLPVALALRRRHDWRLDKLLLQWRTQSQSALQQLPYPMLVAMVLVLGFVGSHAFYPTMAYDDLFLHLRLWSELDFYRRATFDFNGNIWATAPFLVDLQHAVVSLLAGTDSRGSLTLAWAAVLLVLLWQLLATHVQDVWLRGLLLLLFASTPMLGNLLQTLQTELFMAMLVLAGLRLVLAPTLAWVSREMLALLAIAALCCATKLTGAVLGVLLLAAAAVQLWSRTPDFKPVAKMRWHWFAGYLLVLMVVAFHSYFNAWQLTGNPLFPLYNTLFKSPYFGTTSNTIDMRWNTGFTLQGWWNVFFATSHYHEGKDYTAGFQYLLLLPLAVLACLVGRQRRQWLPILLPLVVFSVVMFASMQYWRYLFPVLPLATLAMAALLPAASISTPHWQRHAAMLALAMPLLLNLYFYQGVSWIFRLPPLQTITTNGKQRMTEESATEHALNQWLNRTSPGLRVLYPFESPFGSSLHGTPLYASWYAPPMQAARERIRTRDDLIGFFKEQRIDAVIWNLQESMPVHGPKWQLASYLSRYGFPELQLSHHILYRVTGNELNYQPLFSLENWAGNNSVALPLTADDTPRVLVEVDVERTRAIRYHVGYACGDDNGAFIAQLNWDNGSPYYRLLPCAADGIEFQEGVPVPAGATKASIYVTARDRQQLNVSALTLERL